MQTIRIQPFRASRRLSLVVVVLVALVAFVANVSPGLFAGAAPDPGGGSTLPTWMSRSSGQCTRASSISVLR